MGAQYTYDRNAQLLLGKIFPRGIIKIILNSPQISISFENYTVINQYYEGKLPAFKEFLDTVHGQKYTIDTVWDQQLRSAVAGQLQKIVDEFQK